MNTDPNLSIQSLYIIGVAFQTAVIYRLTACKDKTRPQWHLFLASGDGAKWSLLASYMHLNKTH